MSDQPNPISRPWRRYLRLSLRGLIVLVLVIGVGLAWVVRSAHTQADAVAAIERAGGSVFYRHAWIDDPVFRKSEVSVTRWLVDAIGVDYFATVGWVRLPATTGDEVLAQVERLAGLEQLDLRRSFISDAGLAHLKGLTQLHTLYLDQTHITDAGLAHLSALPDLSNLTLRDTEVTDLGMEHLKRLNDLTILNLTRTQVTDAGLVHLKGLTKLSVLSLDKNQVTGEGKKDLQQALPSLTIAP